jgi:hypothetical protein
MNSHHSRKQILSPIGAHRLIVVAATILLVTISSDVKAQTEADLTPVVATTQPLIQTQDECQDLFIAHVLDHSTDTADGIVRMFEANGSGLAVGDLDNDDDLDLVLGNHLGSNTILWNQGRLVFDAKPFGEGRTRAVTIVDVDADGRRDIVLTTNTGAINYWHNQGDRSFERWLLPGVARPAYAINWGDLDGDGDLDLVTAPYDAGFLTDLGDSYLLSGGSAVITYENQMENQTESQMESQTESQAGKQQGRFVATQLAQGAQALALALTDVNADGRTDILVGNDFGVPDYAFVQSDDGWTETTPFTVTAHSTMSFDLGDVDNDGHLDLFATDMKPYTFDEEMMTAYAPLMADMAKDPHMEGDPQIMENVLQKQTADGLYENQAGPWHVDGTGWSWSAKFGDLDNDGYLDLYVVNGMIEEDIFAHLPNHELIEENQVFRNQAGQTFFPMPSWQLDSTDSGRSMSMADFDGDGDLDIVVNNLRSPAQIFENQLCGGASLMVSLAQPDAQNRDAIGAKVRLLTDSGMLLRVVRSASGYLAGDPSNIHFGFPVGADLDHLEIQWPDGAMSVVENVKPGTLVSVERK